MNIFKYRSTAAALRDLKAGTLYFAKPEKLNDILEAKYDDASHEDFAQVMLQTFNEISLQRGETPLLFDQDAKEAAAAAYKSECQNRKHFIQQLGVFSAAQRANHQAMWAYYADNNTGFCFELELDADVFRQHQLWATDVQYQAEARIHNSADDWRKVFLKLAAANPSASLAELKELSLEEPIRCEWRVLTASRAVSIKHTDWSQENEIRLIAPKSGAIPILANMLKRVHFILADDKHYSSEQLKVIGFLRTNPDYSSVETISWKFSHGDITTVPTPIKFEAIRLPT